MDSPRYIAYWGYKGLTKTSEGSEIEAEGFFSVECDATSEEDAQTKTRPEAERRFQNLPPENGLISVVAGSLRFTSAVILKPEGEKTTSEPQRKRRARSKNYEPERPKAVGGPTPIVMTVIGLILWKFGYALGSYLMLSEATAQRLPLGGEMIALVGYTWFLGRIIFIAMDIFSRR